MIKVENSFGIISKRNYKAKRPSKRRPESPRIAYCECPYWQGWRRSASLDLLGMAHGRRVCDGHRSLLALGPASQPTSFALGGGFGRWCSAGAGWLLLGLVRANRLGWWTSSFSWSGWPRGWLSPTFEGCLDYMCQDNERRDGNAKYVLTEQ